MFIIDCFSKIIKILKKNKSDSNNLNKIPIKIRTLETSIIYQSQFNCQQKNKSKIIFNKITTNLNDVSKIANKRSLTQIKRKQLKKGNINITA